MEIKYPTILASYKMFEYCKKAYPNRDVQSSVHTDHDDFYYWSRTGRMRLVRNKKEIWINNWYTGDLTRIR